MGFATTAPEFVVSLLSALRGLPEIALGNAIGSVVADDALALALAIVIAPAAIIVDSRILKTTGIFLIAIDLLAFGLSFNGTISRIDGTILVGLLVVYLFFVIYSEQKRKKKALGMSYEEEAKDHYKKGSLRKQLLWFGVGVAGVVIASEFLIDSSVNIAHALGIPEVVIGLTIIAIGTSLPEIATCIVAARKGHGDLALGDIIGADVLNEMREGETVIPTVERIESTFGRQPEQFLADSTFATGSNLSALAGRGIEAVMPVEQTKLPDENPADRADATRPVPEEDWPKLPRRAQTKKLDRAAFVYDKQKDCYHCPLGRELSFDYIKMQARDTVEASVYRVYTCVSCEGCGLASCFPKGKSWRCTVLPE